MTGCTCGARRGPTATRNRFQVAPCRAWALLALGFAACGGTRNDYTAEPAEVAIDFAVTHQRISGFGASSAWTLPAASDEQADRFFSVENGLGLSLLRVHIAPTGTTSELVTAQKAVARGARVWAAPWSPPGPWKSNLTPENGGFLEPEHYGDWADLLVDFVVDLHARGVPLLYLSAQNEPGWVAKWESCEWTPAGLTAFIRDELGPRLAATGLPTRVLAPETNDWKALSSFGDALLEDRAATSLVGALATHSYGSPKAAFDYAGQQQTELELWQTEVSDDQNPRDPGMSSALYVASMIHQHLVKANVSAWHYWWLVPGDDQVDNSGLTDRDQSGVQFLTRRAYALGNYSRFVRPGFVRVKAESPRPSIELSAFRDPETSRVVVVAINSSASDAALELVLNAASPTSLTPFVTSESVALEQGDAIESNPSDLTRFSVGLGARSVTSFVGE
jgi:glucuronoarabinoxylan endo-1,4-beta-xylanase